MSASEASAAPLAFSPIALGLLAAWFYSGLYYARHLGHKVDFIPEAIKPALQALALFVGPLTYLGLHIARSPRFNDVNSPWGIVGSRFKDLLSHFQPNESDEVEDKSKLRLFDAMGTDLIEVYGANAELAKEKKSLDITVDIIEDALCKRASDILIDPKDAASYEVRFRIDGMLRTAHSLPADVCKALINSVKAASNMNISERRRPQDGSFTATKGETQISFRVASAGALNGEKLSIRVLNQNAGKFTLKQVGIPERQCRMIAEALSTPSGMVLVCGPTGSGKTNTLYSMLNQIDRHTHNVITVEDPIEAHLPNVSQLEINAKAEITFAKALRSILRQDPDVICIGEIRDEETAEIALRAAQTGHLVLGTIHCDSNATALVRLLDLGVSPLMLSSGLNLLISQRLLRKLCVDCKRPARLTPATLQAFQKKGLTPDHIYAAVGCPRCGETGYFGRLAICDLLPIDERLRGEIGRNGGLLGKLKSDGEQIGRSHLRHEALQHVLSGVTSLEEMKRVTG